MNLNSSTKRPWGCYSVLKKEKGFQIKIISVNPLNKLSLQYHKCRSENWVVIEGIAEITRGNDRMILHPSQSVFIAQNEAHRLSNPSETELLRIVEVQTGGYLEEDDIVRLEDDYSRA
jgi:mannose-1-phosphate guanylyltransferase / mannose-6-phosphate isomerase